MVTRVLAAFLLVLYAAEAGAWGSKGRQLVVEIARGLLDKETIALVDHYTGTASWTEAAAWLETSSTPRNAETRKQWRRVLIARDQTYVVTKSPNLVNQIEYQLMVLEKRSLFPSSSVGEAIKTLFALVADAHQPLRCGYPDDQGGAAKKVKVGEKTMSLLELWDNHLQESRKCDIWDCSKLIMNISAKEKAEIENATPQQWVAESRLLLKAVYELENDVAGDLYLNKAAETAKQQFVKGGLRLAAILNRYFKG